MSNNTWDQMPISHVNALNMLADTLQFSSTTAGRQERRRQMLLALKEAYELGLKSSPRASSSGAAAANE